MLRTITFSLFVSLFFLCSCNGVDKKNKSNILFSDSFSVTSQGNYQDNVIQLPPPKGLGYNWKVLPGGHLPVNWILADELNPDDPKKGFWVIPTDSGYLEQAGRSHNSVLFANTPIPEGVNNFEINFKQYRSDNDPISYVLGASEPAYDHGFEIGYMIQVPGTDSTTTNAYVIGELGEKIVEEMALHHEWADHKIKIENDSVAWFINGNLMIKGKVDHPTYGYFGIRHRYERGTRYDDVAIEVNHIN